MGIVGLQFIKSDTIKENDEKLILVTIHPQDFISLVLSIACKLKLYMIIK